MEINLKEKITFFLKDFVFELINISVEKSFEKEKNINERNNENNGFKNNSKKKKKKKKNQFFLFEIVKNNIKQLDGKNSYQLNNINLELNEKTKIKEKESSLNIIQKEEEIQDCESQKKKGIISSFSEIKIEKTNNTNNINFLSSIPSHINSLTISSSNNSSTSGDSTKNNQINIFNLNNTFNNNIFNENQFFLNHNSLISLFDNLNNDITTLNSEQEILLDYLHQIKKIIYEYFREITNKIYPNSKLEIYGSSLYKLDIECSDLDLCLSSKEKICISLLIKELKNNYYNIYENIFPILSASVPVIKLIINPLKLNNEQINSIYDKIYLSEYYKNYIFDKNEIDKIRVDITINSMNHKQIIFIQKSLINYPSIKYVIKILKRCLYEKNMNQTYKGGMSSYVLFLLTYSFTKWNVIINNKIDSPGELLIDFLFYYTSVIDFNQTLINAKLNNPFLFYNNLETIPTILDPVTMNNAAKSVFRIFDVVKLFNIIYWDIYIIYKKISEDLSNEKKRNIIKSLFENLLK